MILIPSPENQRFIEQQIASGAYRNENEFLAEAVRVLQEINQQQNPKESLIASLEQGIQSLEQRLGK